MMPYKLSVTVEKFLYVVGYAVVGGAISYFPGFRRPRR